MRTLVDQLLDLSRLEARAVEIRPGPIDVRERLEAIAATVGAEVELDVPDELEAVADADAFDRIVTNLVANAARYGAAPITLRAEVRDGHLRLAVEDRGRGVNPDFVPQLFDRFTRSDESASEVQGAGLGLSIAQSFALAHGGRVVYSPAVPHGSRFELVLPQ
jgi:signal transduction histidine kinase